MTSPVGFNTKLKTLEVALQTFSEEHFDDQGFVQPWKLALFHQFIRASGMRVTLSDQHAKLFTHHTVFVRHQRVTIDAVAITKDAHSSQPIYGLFTVLYCGNSSMLFESKIILKNQQRCLSRCKVQLVCVSRENRKPSSFPDAIRNIYSYVSDIKPNIAPLLEYKPSSNQRSYTQNFIIGKEDVDYNRHTNNAAYIKFCVYVASEAITERVFAYITHDILRTKLTEFSVHYIGETLGGDEVVFTVWQGLENKYLLHFEATKNQDVVCRCQLDFRLHSSL